MAIYLVRHADAGARSLWDGEDHHRPLSPRGRAEAEWLADLLAGRSIGRVVSSPYVRCCQTVEPLAQRAGVPVERSTLLAEGAEWVSAYRLLVHLDRHDGLACAHGDLIPYLLRHLRDQGMQVDGAMHDHKGSLWVLETDGGHVVRGTYHRPPAEVGEGVDARDDEDEDVGDAELESA